MMNGTWGHCKNCKYFASPADIPLGDEEARGVRRVRLQRFRASRRVARFGRTAARAADRVRSAIDRARATSRGAAAPICVVRRPDECRLGGVDRARAEAAIGVGRSKARNG
jgi:hypothetical protein